MTQRIGYRRAPSVELQKLVIPGQFLAPLMALNGREFNGIELDVHFRTKDEIQVYWGLTRVLVVRMLQRPDRHLKVDADPKYTEQPSAKATRLFRRWRIGEEGFDKAIESYLGIVDVKQRFTEGEGQVQSQWSRVTEPWVPFDREAVLNYESTEYREVTKQFAQVEAAFERIAAIARRERWKELRTRGRKKVDQLAIDTEGRLVLIELKDAKAASDTLYYVPFQLLQYVWEWHSALDSVRASLQELIDARIAVRLTPPNLARLLGGMRAIIGFGADERSAEVKRRYNIVLEIARHHLPPGTACIETWYWADDGPRRMA